MDVDNLKKQLQGCDAVVHLAALRAPTLAPSEEVFRVNVAGTFNFYSSSRGSLKTSLAFRKQF